MQQSIFRHFAILANHNISLHPPPPTQPTSGRAARHAALLGIVKSDSAAVREQTADSDAIARESHCKQPHHHRPGTRVLHPIEVSNGSTNASSVIIEIFRRPQKCSAYQSDAGVARIAVGNPSSDYQPGYYDAHCTGPNFSPIIYTTTSTTGGNPEQQPNPATYT